MTVTGPARPLCTREARERCLHPSTLAIRSDLPDSYGGRQWCRECGAFFCEAYRPAGLNGVIDWPVTIAYDHADMEREGQRRLPP